MEAIVWTLFQRTGSPAVYLLYKELSTPTDQDPG